MSAPPGSERGFTFPAIDDEYLCLAQSGSTSTTQSTTPSLGSLATTLNITMPAPYKLPGSSAPLPSPSATATATATAAAAAAAAAGGHGHYFAGQHAQAQARPALAQHQHQHLSMMQAEQQQQMRASRQGSGDSSSSGASNYLKDFSLVAEAAKRAQLAVLTRDLEDVTL